ncbi:hypothetical protein [Nonomuraea sp. NPDC049141]|uniref:hypothetical protein n=1 Tax=Nonomuraea sp. NPDC049141 TaxID=3155500 RepID=UPI0033E9A231
MSVLQPNDPTDLSDKMLDAFLSAGDAELLSHVGTQSDPTRALAMLFEIRVDATSEASSTADLQAGFSNSAAQLIQARLLARGLAYSLAAYAGELARDLEHARVQALVGRLYLSLDLPLAHDLAICLDLEHARTLANDLERLLSIPRAHALGLARTLADYVDSHLMRIPVDASGVDLTVVVVEGDGEAMAEVIGALAGVMWDEETRWPPQLQELVVSCSVELGPGRYQVRSGTERDSRLPVFGH